jgi:MFS family permease
MWELYAFWAWIGAALLAAFTAKIGPDAAQPVARAVTFAAIAIGGLMCVPAGFVADRTGKAQVAGAAMALSALSGLAMAFLFGGPVWLVATIAILWGASVIPDSAQLSALVAEAAPPERAGSLLTLQTALGFTLTFFTVQALPAVADAFGWRFALAIMAFGPILGIDAMRRLIGTISEVSS